MNQPGILFIVSVLLIISIPDLISAQSLQVQSNQIYTTQWFLNLLCVMALTVMGLYNYVIFVMRPKDRAPLHFGTFCVLIAVNNFVSSSGVSFLTDLFPNISGLLLRKIDVVTIILSIPFFIIFLHAFYPIIEKVVFKRIALALAVIFCAATILSSAQSLEWIFHYYFPVILLSIVYVIITAVRALRLKLNDVHGVLAGIIIMSVAGINDVLWGYGLLHTFVMIPFATLLFAMIYSALISRRFAYAMTSAERLNAELLENQRLRAEMQQRTIAEQDMRQAQRRLTALLHTVESPLCAASANGNIVFCNRAFEELVGQTMCELIGKEPLQFIRTGIRSTNIPLELEDEQLSVHIFEQSDSGVVSDRSVVTFVAELNKNRARIRSLEELLVGTNSEILHSSRDLRHDLEIIDRALEQMSTLLIHDNDLENKKRLGIEVLSLSITYWSECMNTTKFELAEESGLWKVQVNPDGWKRTQTLDRYLDYKTFPQNPRWNQIVKTGDFVLIRCRKPSEFRTQLEISLQKFCLQTEFPR